MTLQTTPTPEQQALIEEAKKNNSINKDLLKEVDKNKSK